MPTPSHAFVVAALLALVAPSTGHAQESGLLLGVTGSDPGTGEGGYRTLWIAREGGRLAVLASGPDLIVPRRSGFWRVCLVGHLTLEEGELREWDSLVARPATANRGACARHAAGPTEAQQSAARCRASDRSDILFLGSDAVSIEEHGETDCGAHYSGGTKVVLQSLDDGREVNLENLMERPARDELIRRALESGQAEFSDLGTLDTIDTSVDDSVVGPSFRLLHEWGIERGEGAWQVVGHAYCSPYVACGDGLRRFSIPGLPPPTSVAGHDALTPTMDRIKAVVRGAKDAVASPRGDLVAVLTGDSLLVYTPRAGELGQAVLRQELDGRVVLAQWALGRFVPVWTREMRAILRRDAGARPAQPRVGGIGRSM